MAIRRTGGIRWRGPFRHRNYRLFWFGQLISLAGTWMQSIAQAWLITELSPDPTWLGVIAAAQFTPVLALGLFGGVIADHLPKRPTLMALQALLMCLATLQAVLVASRAKITHCTRSASAVVPVCSAVLAQNSMPSTWQALVISIGVATM